MATQDISQLVVEVQSKGIQTAANQLNKLADASTKAEAAVKKLGTLVVSTQAQTGTAQAQADANSVSSATATAAQILAIAQKRDLELYRIRTGEADRLRSIQEKRDIEEWQSATAQATTLAAIQQKRDTELYESRVAEAARVKAIQEKRDIEEYNAAQEQSTRIKAIEEKRDIELYTMRVEQESKMKAIQEKRDMEEYTSAQAEVARMIALEEKRDIELYEMRVAANAKIAAAEEKQRQMNAAFQTASIATQIRNAKEAQAYSAMGGDSTARFGSAAATADVALLTAEQKRLAEATARARAEQNAQNAAMAEASALARGLSGSLGALWVTYGNFLGMGVGIAIGASLKGVISVGKDVENTLESLRVLGGATTSEMDQMGKAVHDLGQGAQGPKDVAEALSVLTMAGLTAKEALQGVGAALNLSIAGGVSVEKSAETLVQVGSALGYTADGFDHVADVIAKTAAASMSSVDSISNAFKSAAAVGEVYGASLNDIAIGLAAVANLGIQGTSAGTALKNFYKDLSASTQKVTQTLKDMHLSISDFRDSQGFMLPLVDVITKLNAGMGTLDGKARSMAMVKLFSQQGAREGAELLKLINTASKEIDPEASEKAGKAVTYVNKLVELQAQIQQAAAFSTQAAIAMQQTTSNQLKSVGNTLQTTFIEVFKSIEPQIGEVARSLRAAFASPDFKAGLTSLMTGIADLTKFTVDHAKAIGYVVAAMAAWKIVETATALVEMAKDIEITTTAMKAFTISLGPIAVAILALATAWTIYKANKDTALDNHAGTNNLQDYINNTVKAAQREAEVLEMRKNNASEADILRKQQMDADKDAADSALKAAEKELNGKRKYVEDMKKAMEPEELAMANQAQAQGIAKTNFSAVDKYLNATKSLASAEQAYGMQVLNVKNSEKSLADLRQQNADAATAAARKQLENRPTGDGQLSGKVDTKGANDAYNAFMASQQGIIKAASQSLEQFREQEQAKFKAGSVGQLQVINDTADQEIATYQKVAEAARAAEAKANATPNKTADAQRYADEAKRAEASAAQAQKMRLESRVTAQRTAETTITNLKVKSLEDQGKYVEAANLKWSADGKTALQQAEADLDKYGDKFPWLGELVKAYGQVRDDAMNSAQLKQDALEFDSALVQVQETLKGVKSAEFGGSIGTVMDSAIEATNKFESALTKAKAKRNDLWVDALTTGSDAAIKKYNEANKEIESITDKQKTMWQEVADTITNSLTQAFGNTGKSLGELNKAMIEYQQSDNASAEDRAKQYGDMAQAASGFFDKQSKGYKVLNGLSQIFHVAEMARTLVRTAAYVAEGAANMFGQGGFAGFAGVAAMGAVMAGLGWAAMGGTVSGADPTQDAEYVQKHQGTGTVFGDSDAKSDSISKSLDDLKNNSDVTLPLTQKMVSSLSNIESAMGGLANFAIRGGVTDGSNFNVQTGTLSRTGDNGLLMSAILGNNAKGGAIQGALLGSVFGPIGTILGGIGGAIVGKIASLWGKTSQEITDSGLQFGGKVGNLEQGSGFDQYANVKTTSSSWFGLSKSSSNNVLTQGVSSQLSQQFGLVFSGLEDALKGAATSLGTNSDAVGKAVENVVLDTTKVSLKDLKGQDLTDAINNVMSAAMDQIAQAVYPQMQDFEQVGEGYAQTVIRVASGVEQADVALKQLGITAINYTDIQNKQGDVALELARQSILAKEGMNGIGQMLENMTGTVTDLTAAYKALDAIRTQMNAMGLDGTTGLNSDMVSGAGGVSQLQSALSSYQDKYFTDQEKSAIMLKTVTAEFNKLGLSLPATKAALSALIDQTTTANPYLAGQLIVLAGDYDSLTTAVTTATQSQTDALNTTIDGLNKFKDSLKSLRDSLALSDSSILTPVEKMYEAQQQYQDTIAKAKAGDTTAQDNVSSVAQAYLDASRTVNASSQAYTDTYNQVMNDLGVLGSSADDQLSNAEKQLQALQDQVSSLDQLNQTADAIRLSLDSPQIAPGAIASTTPVVVDTSALEAQIADLKTQLADAQSTNDQKLDTLAAVVYNSQSDAADQISETVTTTAQQATWVATTLQTLNMTR